jgi:Kdo2-lipid IVA lauroyltransferase/acyltransferase
LRHYSRQINSFIMQYIGYLGFRFVVFLFSVLPFSAMYRLSNGVAWLLFKVVGYRKKIVFKQLRDSFPDKSAAEINRIAWASYQNLSDILLESFKGFSMTKADFSERYVFTNPEAVHDNPESGGNSIQMAAHYTNWEWGVISLPLFIKRHIVGIYKPLSNRFIENYGRKKRGQFGIELVPIGETAAAFPRLADKPSAYFFVSDQNTNSDKAHWVTFLNQDTACPYGGDKYARQYDFPAYYLDMQRVKRGYYQLTFEKIATDVPNLPAEEVTKRFMARLEKTIVAQPENWLWTHKRWKKKRAVQNG